nr:hypothetical protein [Candidatus Sigynarchaeota archaeon]
MANEFDSILRNYMYKLAGINHVVLAEKDTGKIISSFAKFQTKKSPQEISTISSTINQLSKAIGEELDTNITEFNDGEKLFTINGGRNVTLSAISDKTVQLGISRMYLKRFAESMDKAYQRVIDEAAAANREDALHEIFMALSKIE